MVLPSLRPSKLIKRLLPLYVAAFLQGFVLWYAVEKLFMTSIGFTDATIGIMVAAYSVMSLLTETPSGILADRWSRKGVLIIAGLALAASGLVAGLSTTVVVFIMGAVLWGFYDALYSGTYESIVYDTLLEETGSGEHYERYYGHVRIVEGVALVGSAFAGGLIAELLGPRASFLWTIPVALLSVLVLTFFKEPKLHKAEAPEPILAHIKLTFKALMHRDAMIGILALLVLIGIVSETIFEFSQLWLLAIGTPALLFGFASGVLYSAFGTSGVLAPLLKLGSRKFVVALTALLTLSGLTLVYWPSTWPVTIAQTIIGASMLAIEIGVLARLHDRLTSNIRAGAASAVATLTRVLFILVALIFGWLSQEYSIFTASWLIFIPLIAICVLLYQSAGNSLREPKSKSS